MMREIKFRGKRKDNGEWIEGFYYKRENQDFIITKLGIEEDENYWEDNFGYPPSSEDYHLTGIFEVLPETVGQFTNLKDKNGKDIFEGDRLKTKDEIFIEEARDNGFVILVVKWNAEEGEWQIESEKIFPSDIDGKLTRSINKLNIYWTEDIEIIGTVHEANNG